MVDIAAGLSMAAQAIAIAKDLRDIDKSLDIGEFKAKMAELYGSLADVKMALADAQSAMKEKDAEIARLQEAFRARSEMVEYHGFKYQAFPTGDPKGYPYCPRCENTDGRFHMLTKFGKGMLALQCPECKSEYHGVATFVWNKENTS